MKLEKKSKRKPWQRRSSRGIELLNFMEMYHNPPDVGTDLSLRQKLRQLAERYTQNKFYQRLLKKKAPFTKKEIRGINLDYNLKYKNG